MTDTKGNNTSKKLVASLEDIKETLASLTVLLKALEKRVTEEGDMRKLNETAVLTKLNEIDERVAAGAKARPAAPRAPKGKASAAGQSGVTPKQKPHHSSLYWFKAEYIRVKDVISGKFCTPDMLTALEEYVTATPDVKKLEAGSEKRLAKEAVFIWNNYVKAAKKGTPESENKSAEDAKDQLRKRIRIEFDKYKSAFTSSSNTEAVKEQADEDD